MDEIVPHNPDMKLDLKRQLEAVAEVIQSSLTVKHLEKYKAKYGIFDQVELVPPGDDEVYTHCPGYCALYTYPFTIGNFFPLPSLVEEFCRHY